MITKNPKPWNKEEKNRTINRKLLKIEVPWVDAKTRIFSTNFNKFEQIGKDRVKRRRRRENKIHDKNKWKQSMSKKI